MMKLSPSMRLKVNRDTFFLPDGKDSVYFRNNAGSFRMGGKAIQQWVEKLIPMYSGEFTLKDLTEGLPGPYRDRVYEISETLYKNGFLRDLSEENPHDLPENICKKYASQIEFLNSFGNSGAYRFQEFRKSKVLLVGAGSIFLSAVNALLESGLPKFHTLITDSMPTNRKRLSELTVQARKTDPDVAISMVTIAERNHSWREIVNAFDCVVYVSQQGELEELQTIESACRKVDTLFMCAVCVEGFGMAGPLVQPGSAGDWTAAWTSLHTTVFEEEKPNQPYSSTAGAMLVNVCAFELFKKMTEATTSTAHQKFYLLNLFTMEGKWHFFQPKPSVLQSFKQVDVRKLSEAKRDTTQLLLAFSHLTSEVSGVFHKWEEGDLSQIPLSQCWIQTVDPLSEGPAELLSAEICSGLTHHEVRREAGLVGLERYSEKLITKLDVKDVACIGAGESSIESVSRGLQKCLLDELQIQTEKRKMTATMVKLKEIQDKHCRFYLQALRTMGREPQIGLGKEISGLPVVWVKDKERAYGSPGLTMTDALRNALHHFVTKHQNKSGKLSTQAIEAQNVMFQEKEPMEIDVQTTDTVKSLQAALQILENNRRYVEVFDLAMDPLLKKEQTVVVGVVLRKEDPLL
ncbi:putative thiazole-containing bacteriocin maturation protein [Bacillus sp. Marseille-Q3570]|uniref:putative thiazole-containing bacteriocin maturation protein n=1 Tax=Bacillus sp. Marseille-Q3570 TaxID=2963522 RepID=UPI0021B8225A|nr:putative thiazole-containing bacteriocin maturation protein [Bacillus sp. Marseille-Q3570]